MENKNLNDLQKEGIEKWDGADVLSVYPGGSYGNMSFANAQDQSINATEFWCAMEVLDDLEVPRKEEGTNRPYSIVGRIMWLKNNK